MTSSPGAVICDRQSAARLTIVSAVVLMSVLGWGATGCANPNRSVTSAPEAKADAAASALNASAAQGTGTAGSAAAVTSNVSVSLPPPANSPAAPPPPSPEDLRPAKVEVAVAPAQIEAKLAPVAHHVELEPLRVQFGELPKLQVALEPSTVALTVPPIEVKVVHETRQDNHGPSAGSGYYQSSGSGFGNDAPAAPPHAPVKPNGPGDTGLTTFWLTVGTMVLAGMMGGAVRTVEQYRGYLVFRAGEFRRLRGDILDAVNNERAQEEVARNWQLAELQHREKRWLRTYTIFENAFFGVIAASIVPFVLGAVSQDLFPKSPEELSKLALLWGLCLITGVTGRRFLQTALKRNQGETPNDNGPGDPFLRS